MTVHVFAIFFQFDAEFRRFSVDRSKVTKFDDFSQIITKLHLLQNDPFVITYTDIHGDLLPINNDDNFGLALATAKPVLRILVQKKGETFLRTQDKNNKKSVNGVILGTISHSSPLKHIL